MATYNENYENREKFSMSAGYFPGESKYSGWIIEKSPNYDRKIDEFVYVAGCSDGIYINKNNDGNAAIQNDKEPTLQFKTDNISFVIVGYLEKAITLFGDTKEIKDLIKATGGK